LFDLHRRQSKGGHGERDLFGPVIRADRQGTFSAHVWPGSVQVDWCCAGSGDEEISLYVWILDLYDMKHAQLADDAKARAITAMLEACGEDRFYSGTHFMTVSVSQVP